MYHTSDDKVDLRNGPGGRPDGLASPAGRARHEGASGPPESAGRGGGQAEHRHGVEICPLGVSNVMV